MAHAMGYSLRAPSGAEFNATFAPLRRSAADLIISVVIFRAMSKQPRHLRAIVGIDWRLPCLLLLLLAPGTLVVRSEIYPVRIHSATQAVAAVAIGDFNPLHAEKEIAFLMANGDVIELIPDGLGWTATTIFKNPGAAPESWDNPASRATLEIGDVLSANPGNELVISIQQLSQRQVIAVYHAPLIGWTNQVIADFSELIGVSWGARIGEMDATHPAAEVFCIYEGVFDFSNGFVFSEKPGGWETNTVYGAEVGMDAAIGNSNPDAEGNEIIVVTEMGPTYEITPPPGGGPGPWPKRVIWDDFANAGWVVKIADVDPDAPGNEIVYGTRYSNRIMMSRHQGTNHHDVEILFTGSNTNEELNNMLDVAVGQVLPGSPTAEILGVDASGSVYLVQRLTNQWHGSVLWRDTNALYAVQAADLLPTPGDEVVVAGESGAVTLLLNPEPTLNVTLMGERHTVVSWPAIAGLTYTVEAATNLTPATMWQPVTHLVYQDGFSGTLFYTNSAPDPVMAKWFRVLASW